MSIKQWIYCCSLIGLICLGFSEVSAQKVKNEDAIVTSSRQVIHRLIGPKAKDIRLALLPDSDHRDVFEVSAKAGVLSIKGSSPSAICYGFYDYLRNHCYSMVSWSGQHVPIPIIWPDYEGKAIVSPYLYRYYLNVVTFGYTTPYWGWNRWEKELDWMALHGINMPLATVASEAIAARVWRRLGLSEAEIVDFFTGPAHLPWHRMGNLNKWDGPIPEHWHRDQLALQHQILDRMRALGMHPIAPAFAGFVPEGFKKKHPELKVNALKWGGFPSEYNAYMLPPGSAWFERIGKLFIEEWEKEFGKNQFYLSDSFNEMDVPVSKGHPEEKYALLGDYGESIYRSIHAGNPDAVWVTQGWTFGYQPDFWDKPSLKAMLAKVPDDKMMILDLANEFPEHVWHIPLVWKTHEGFYGKQWVYSFVPNFGGKTAWTGVLSQYASSAIDALRSPYSQHLVGFGFAPEGIENNEVVYELLADMAWARVPIDLGRWLERYSKARYGGYPQAMKEAWQGLTETAYGSFGAYPRFLWQTVNFDQRRKGRMNSDSRFLQAAKQFLSCADQLKSSPLYRNDALEIVMHYLGAKADQYYAEALQADSLGQKQRKEQLAKQTIDILKAIDRLLESHPTDRLQAWVDFARAKGKNKTTKDYYESNAKRLITTWGGVQNDYAARLWSGLIRDYYIPRITLRLSGKEQERAAWEEQWIKTPGISKLQPYADPVAEAKTLLDTY